MESCAPGLQAGFFFFFPFIEKLTWRVLDYWFAPGTRSHLHVSGSTGEGRWGKKNIHLYKKKKLYPPVCSTMRASLWPEAIGREIAITAKLEKKGRIIFLYWEKIKN